MTAIARIGLAAHALLLLLPACAEEAPAPAVDRPPAAMPNPAPKPPPEITWFYWVFGPDGRQGERQEMTEETTEIRVGDLVVEVGPITKEREKQGGLEMNVVTREITCEGVEISIRGTKFDGNRFGYSANDEHTAGIYGLTTFDFTEPGTGKKLGSITTKLHAE